MRLLFIDDEPDSVDAVAGILREALDADIEVVATIEAAVAALHERPPDLVVADIFIPLGRDPARTLGPRATSYQETVQHIGGLVLLDELDRLHSPPPVIAHTACTDIELIEILGEHVVARVPKPAPVDVLLRAVLEALDLPAPQ